MRSVVALRTVRKSNFCLVRSFTSGKKVFERCFVNVESHSIERVNVCLGVRWQFLVFYH